jgi:hypothetical protein
LIALIIDGAGNFAVWNTDTKGAADEARIAIIITVTECIASVANTSGATYQTAGAVGIGRAAVVWDAHI